ncbi:M66 family metalloprotease [Mobilicoccus pelagius]|uniref:Peptidase M10 metallopeptidase domain-containing protein n=1 Tax=Mobilicoccus pelagius NBRC 104925 TaxID=1089455 RepID=H5UMK8_9MICO|nr:M66 family metalloprotease [Mobilicoccus pelagius]GAB46966.1 hypothetical protein MOPEL_001_00860 [Mobilicoccus pelagius NBRC 104925]
MTASSVAAADPGVAVTRVAASPSATVATTGARVAVRGTVTGGDREVRLQQLVGRTWRTVDEGQASGSFTLTVPTGRADVATYRVLAPATDELTAGASRSFRVGVGEGSGRSWAALTTPPVRWDPCTPIGYRVNLRGAPEGALADVHHAVAQASAASGLKFRYLGTTSVVPGSSSTSAPSTYPADTALVVAFATPSTSRFLGRGTDVLGVGGVFYDLHPAKVGRTTWHRAVQGYVVLDAGRELPGGFGTGSEKGVLGTRGQVLMHELGHALGLDHPTTGDQAQIMFHETTYKEARWGAGDLTGLRRLGATSGCFPEGKGAPTASTRDAVRPGRGAPMFAGVGHVAQVGHVRAHESAARPVASRQR